MRPKFPPIKSAAEQARLNALAADLEALARMVHKLAGANDRSEPVVAGVVKERIPAAAAAITALQAELGEQNAASVVRWSNDQFAAEAKAAGGVLAIQERRAA